MEQIHRRRFIKKSAFTAGGVFVAPAYIKNFVKNPPDDRVNIALAGISGTRPRVRGMISGRGIAHINGYSKVPGTMITHLCDVDERLFPTMSAEVEKAFGARPKTEPDFRRLLDDKDIDVISIATTDHWHALHTIWACQAGKDVYIEKPVSYNVSEGRKMVQAVDKYKRIVQAGICYRCSEVVKEAVKFIHEGKLGKVYMAKGRVYSYRPSIGHVEDSPVPEGVNWDRFLGPAPYRPFNENRFLYNWHWFWDMSTTEFGNNGIYRMDTIRWALKRNTHPVKITCTGGKFCRDDDQEVPNMILATYEYEDGMIIHNEIRSLYTNPEGLPEYGDCFIYSDQGWMSISAYNGFRTYFGQKNEPGPALTLKDVAENVGGDGWKNFIDCVRSRKREDLANDILEGHMSAALGHLGVISYRTGRKLTFNPATEKFVKDKAADKFLTREYRKPYVVPDVV